jgi:DNA-binding PadR family transcriptional regulator
LPKKNIFLLGIDLRKKKVYNEVILFSRIICARNIMRYLSRKEEMVMLIIWRLGENAYGVTIRDAVMEISKKYWSIGAIYDVLDRLTRGGFVSRSMGESMKERGGRRKRLYRITKAGYEALQELSSIQKQIWSDLPKLEFEE